MNKKDLEDREEFNAWECLTCKDEMILEGQAVRDHLAQVHGIDAKTATYSKSWVSHGDAQFFYESKYRIRIKGTDVVFSLRMRRKRTEYDLFGNVIADED